jgi:hypothetical protein
MGFTSKPSHEVDIPEPAITWPSAPEIEEPAKQPEPEIVPEREPELVRITQTLELRERITRS